MEKQFVRRAMLVIAGLLIFGFVGVVSQGRRLLNEDKQSADAVYSHGFQVGRSLAKSGMVKPTSEELDAYARKAALQLNDKGGLGFKVQWKNGFDTGWRTGD